MTSKKFISWAIFIILALVWGSSFILMKKSADQLTGWQIGSTRIAAAGLVFFPFAIFHIRAIPIKKLPLVILSGLLGNLFPAFLFAIAIEKKIDSSLAAILNSLTPLFVIVVGILFFKARIEQKKIAGVLTGFIGLLILNLSKGPIDVDDLGFSLLILLATVFYGINVNMVSHYLKDLDPIKMATVSMAFIGIPAAIIMWQQNVPYIAANDEEARLAVYLATLLGITGSAIATALFYLLIKKSGGLFASLVTYAIPIVAIFWGLMANENVTLIQVGCLGMILGGVYLANK